MFEQVESDSTNVWKWEMFRLVDDFDNRPVLPSPLTAFETFFNLIKVCWKKCCRNKVEDCKRIVLIITCVEYLDEINFLFSGPVLERGK